MREARLSPNRNDSTDSIHSVQLSQVSPICQFARAPGDLQGVTGHKPARTPCLSPKQLRNFLSRSRWTNPGLPRKLLCLDNDRGKNLGKPHIPIHNRFTTCDFSPETLMDEGRSRRRKRTPRSGRRIDVEASYTCDSCGEEIVVPIDPSAGESQEYVEDCPVCCCPNVICVEFDEAGTPRVDARRE